MKFKIVVSFTLALGIVLSQTTADTTNVNLESDKKFEQNLIAIQSDIEILNKMVFMLDSLLRTNQTHLNEKIGQLEKSITEQTTNIEDQIKTVYIVHEKIKQELSVSISGLDKKVSNNLSIIEIEIDSLKYNLDKKSKELDSAIAKANTRITTLNEGIKEVRDDNKYQIDSLDQKVNKTISDRSLYWIIAILILLIILIAVFFFLKSKVAQQQESLSSVKDTQEQLENESIQLDTKLIQLLEQQLEIAQQQPQQSTEIDHSLPLKLAEEIHRMRKRLKTMEESRATEVLNKRLESLEEKINDMGYEIIELLGRSFDDGMELGKTQFIPDENLKDGERIITRVIKPRITFKDKIIQHGNVVISQGD